jgi:hypothetical protein
VEVSRELTDSIKAKEFLGQLSNYELLKKAPAPWVYLVTRTKTAVFLFCLSNTEVVKGNLKLSSKESDIETERDVNYEGVSKSFRTESIMK